MQTKIITKNALKPSGLTIYADENADLDWTIFIKMNRKSYNVNEYRIVAYAESQWIKKKW